MLKIELLGFLQLEPKVLGPWGGCNRLHGYVLGSTDVKRLPTCRRVVDDDSGFVHPLDLVIKVHGLFRKVLQVDLNLDEVSVNGFLVYTDDVYVPGQLTRHVDLFQFGQGTGVGGILFGRLVNRIGAASAQK